MNDMERWQQQEKEKYECLKKQRRSKRERKRLKK